MQVTIGRIVHYQLSAGDVAQIDNRHPIARGQTVRNRVSEGDVLPAMVVAVFSPNSSTANLKVFLDGEDCYWATSRGLGDAPGTWAWPPRA